MSGKGLLGSVLATALVLIMMTGLALAQTPTSSPVGTAFSYQGYLRSSSIPVTGMCDFQFGLYDDLTSGKQLGALTMTDVVVDKGLFTVRLDYGSGVFTGDALWLETSVRCPAGGGTYTPLSPRQTLTAAPYALFAINAGDAWSLKGNAGTVSGTNFLGTIDDQALEFMVNGTRALRLEPTMLSPNIVGGHGGNWLAPDVFGATIGGGGQSGWLNRVTDGYGFVGGGADNQAGDDAGSVIDAGAATVAGGGHNTASGQGSAVGGGFTNLAAGQGAAVSGGFTNTASGNFATVGGGQASSASGQESTVAGGAGNVASGLGSMIPGGNYNVAAGDLSFAAGYRAHADRQGCFVWADMSTKDGDLTCETENQWLARTTGGVYFQTNYTGTTGVYVAPGGNSWLGISDRATKMNLAPADGSAILETLASLPVQEYNLISQGNSVRHVGLVAQDFAAFGYGESDKAINMQDVDGIALAAIQALHSENRALRAQVAGLEQQNASLDARLTRLELAAGAEREVQTQSTADSMPWLLLGGLVIAGGSFSAFRRTGGGG